MAIKANKNLLVLHKTAAGRAVAPLLCVLCIPPAADMCWMRTRVSVARCHTQKMEQSNLWQLQHCQLFLFFGTHYFPWFCLFVFLSSILFGHNKQQAIRICISASTQYQLKFPRDTGMAQDARQDGNSAINIKWSCHHPPHNHIRSSSGIRILWSVK